MLRILAKLLKILNSEADPSQISLAFSLSLIAGLTPLLSFHNFLILFLILVLRVNLSAFLLGLVFFTGIAYLLDPLFHSIGLAILTLEGAKGLWTTLYNSSLGQIEKFYNTVVMGSLVFSIVLFLPLYLLSNFLILKDSIGESFKNVPPDLRKN